MKEAGKFKIWMAQIRANFLILAVLLVGIGLAYAWKYQGSVTAWNTWHAVLLVVGIVLTHVSVNLFNEYSDYKTKIDFSTDRTPFSGGSGMLTGGHTTVKSVRNAAILTLVVSAIIGLYFVYISHWSLLVIMAMGAFAIVFYTNFLARIMMGELFAGLALGTLVVLGTYIAMTASPGMAFSQLLPLEVILISIPPGILTSLLLLLNEFPDAEADRKGGRKHLVIKFGKKTAAIIYTTGIVFTFGIIIMLPLFQIASAWIYIALLPLPLAINACATAIKHGDNNLKLVPALGKNVITILATDLLITLSVLFAMM